MSTIIQVTNVSKSYKDNIPVITDVSFDIQEGEIICILGESGSGKSTLLRLMGGMEDADTGEVYALDEKITGPKHNLVPGYDFINFVFQNFRLEPFRTVRDNIYSVISYYQDDILEERIEELLQLCKLTDKAKSFPRELSGGQQQRVAIAMALADEPEILLMDEPFSNLDVSMKTQIREEIVEILREAQVTVVMVSHDPVDALAIADRAMVLESGNIVQIDSPEKIYDAPKTPYAAKFLGPINFLDLGKKNPVGVRPEKLKINTMGEHSGLVTKCKYFGMHHHISIESSLSKSPVLIYHDKSLKVGQKVQFSIKEK